MSSKPRQQYTAEFKAHAIELLDTGKPVSQIAEELCISSNLPYNHAAVPTLTQLSDQQTGDVIETIFKRHRRRYGYRRIWQEVQFWRAFRTPISLRENMVGRDGFEPT